MLSLAEAGISIVSTLGQIFSGFSIFTGSKNAGIKYCFWLEPERVYRVVINGNNAGNVNGNLSGKVNFNVETKGGAKDVVIEKIG